MPRDAGAQRISRHAVWACLLEATARKPGNVHPEASFADLTYQDFVRSAHLIAASFEHGADWPVGRIVFDAVERTQLGVGRNTNLGILLLLAPFAVVPAGVDVRDGIGDVLARTDARRCRAGLCGHSAGKSGRIGTGRAGRCRRATEYHAARGDAPGGRPRSIAAQYANGFATVLAGAERLATKRSLSREMGRGRRRPALVADGRVSRHADSAEMRCRAGRTNRHGVPASCWRPAGPSGDNSRRRKWPSSTVGYGLTETVATQARRPTWWPDLFSPLCATTDRAAAV